MDHCCKVGRITHKYGIRQKGGLDIDDYLRARWKGKNNYPEASIREIQDWLNKQILKEVYRAAGRSTIETHIDADYQTLTGDDPEAKEELAGELEADGIDAEELIDDFIPTSTLHRHFSHCLEEQKPKEVDEDSNWEADKVDYIRSSATEGLRDVLESLDNKGRLPHGSEANINISLYVSCPICGTGTELDRALDRGYICETHMAEDDGLLAGDDDGVNASSTG